MDTVIASPRPTSFRVIAVVALLWNLLGALGLLLKKRWAVAMLGLSLIGQLVQLASVYALPRPGRSVVSPTWSCRSCWC
ncbi:MAG: hypothetical protein ACR2J7_04865 [Luteimonas sp.]